MILATRYKMKPPPSVKPIRSVLSRLGCVGLWLFNEWSGDQVFDLSGNGNTGTLIATAHFGPGKFGPALILDGDSDYAEVADHPSLDFGISDFSCVIWLKSPDVGVASIWVLGFGDADVNEAWWGFSIYGGKIFAQIDDGTNSVSFTANTVMDDNQWHQVALIFERDDVITVYLDSVADGTSAAIAAVGSVSTTSTRIIGGRQVGGNVTSFSTSDIDHIMIFNRALSAYEIPLLSLRPFYLFERRARVLVSIPAAARSSSGIGFKPIRGADRLRGLRRIA